MTIVRVTLSPQKKESKLMDKSNLHGLIIPQNLNLMPNMNQQSLQTQQNNRVKIQCQTLNQQSLQTQQNNRVKIQCQTLNKQSLQT
jgi:hypothetical protein